MSQPPTTHIPAYGAVDLSALARPATPPLGSTSANGQQPGGLIIDVDEQTFEAEVLDRSMTVPVVIDMWASWCQPCKTLTPILERLATADAGRWILAKIDIDANQQIAAAFGVQSIPSVFAVIGGRPMALFQGAIPEADARRVMDEMLRIAAANGVTGTVQPTEPDAPAEPPRDRFADAIDALRAGDLDGAETAFQDLLADNPADSDAKAGLARVALLRRVRGIDPARATAAADAAPHDFELQRTAADVEAAAGQFTAAFDRLIGAIRASAPDQREPLRAHLLTLFEVAGPGDPAVSRARTALANALF
jgi:putative thioredoxin